MPAPSDTVQNSRRTLGQKLFLAIYFGSHKIPLALSFLLQTADLAVRGITSGVWLGLLTPRLILALDDWYYTRGYPMYMDVAYNKSGLFNWEQEAVNTYFLKSSYVLIAAGAGAGREMLALNRMGIRTDGFEYNPALVRLGNTLLAEEGWTPSIEVAPPDRLPPLDRTYDAAIIGWGTYTLIEGSAMRTALLRQIRSRCAPGAPLLVSFYFRSGSAREFRVTALIANVLRKLLRRPGVEIGDTIHVGYSHRFTEQEIKNELTASGFEPVMFRSEPYAHAVALAV